jgi:general secretion pathway protein D
MIRGSMALSRSKLSGLLAVSAALLGVEVSLAQNGRPPAPIIRTPLVIGKGKTPIGLSSGAAAGTAGAAGAPAGAGTSTFPTAVPPPPPPPSPFRAAQGGDATPATPDAAMQKLPPGNVTIGFQEADLPDLVNWIGGLTGRRFIYGSKVRQIKVSLYSPQPVSVAEAYRAFLVALETNGLTVVPHGRFLKIVDSAGVVTQETPIYTPGQPVPAEDRYVTRLYRLQNVGAEEASQLLTKFKSKEGDISTYAPGNLLILTDTGSNIRRMLRIVEEIDVGKAGDQLWVEPIHYGTASDMSTRLNDIFDIKPTARRRGPPRSSPTTGPTPSSSSRRRTRTCGSWR